MVLSEGLVHSETFQTKPCWYFYSDLFSVTFVDTVPVQQPSYSSVGSRSQIPYIAGPPIRASGDELLKPQDQPCFLHVKDMKIQVLYLLFPWRMNQVP